MANESFFDYPVLVTFSETNEEGTVIGFLLGQYSGPLPTRFCFGLGDDLKLRVLRQLADQLGYRLAKRPGPAVNPIVKYLQKKNK